MDTLFGCRIVLYKPKRHANACFMEMPEPLLKAHINAVNYHLLELEDRNGVKRSIYNVVISQSFKVVDG